jgi:hypothetical protein
MATREQAIQAVREYTGDPTLKLKTWPDPKVPGCWALQDEEGNGYLISGNVRGVPTMGDVEEVEFETWPPKSGPLNFFI